MIIFNLVGLLIAGAACVVWAGVLSLTGPSAAVSFVVGGLAAAAGDAFYRYRRLEGSLIGAALSPFRGGHLMFVPIWIGGLIAIGMGAHDYWRCPTRLSSALDRRATEVRARLAAADATLALATTDAAKAARPVTPADFPVRPVVDVPNGRANVAFVAKPSYLGGPLDRLTELGYAEYAPDENGAGCGPLGNLPCGGIYDLVALSEHRAAKVYQPGRGYDRAERVCDRRAADQIAQALAMRYIVSEAKYPKVYLVLDVEAQRLLGRLEVAEVNLDRPYAEHVAAFRQALARQSGGSFDYGPDDGRPRP